LVGDLEKEEGFLNERSPITYVDKIKATMNLLIIQGANDPKVVKNESDQIVERLRNKGIRAEYMIFDDEGHGFTKYSNLIKAPRNSWQTASHYRINYNKASLSPTGHKYH
jgi:dipeptidyl aminopeptidase/acylaminoacyl peptidase